mmetsp:Transcript_11710/g.16644  ORF Transcript_11710/g.16644 Transcript_11710/m.16644 type:complete len:113 (-) Transcript_11710:1358-1696(-)
MIPAKNTLTSIANIQLTAENLPSVTNTTKNAQTSTADTQPSVTNTSGNSTMIEFDITKIVVPNSLASSDTQNQIDMITTSLDDLVMRVLSLDKYNKSNLIFHKNNYKQTLLH